MAPRYGPPDASLAPRYTGVRTFARLPHVTEPEGVDAAVVGVPFDTATSFRPGRALRARGDPRGVAAAAAVAPAARGRRVREPVARRLGRPGGHARQRGADRGADPRGAAAARRGRDHAARARRRPLDRARRAARARRAPRPARARPDRRPRRHLGRVLRRALLPRHAVPARVRGGPARARALDARRDARAALRARRPRRAARLGLRDPLLRRAARARRRPSTGGSCASAPATGRCSCRSTST